MSESYKEQRPLLCDEYSDDEVDVKGYNRQRRNLPSVCSGRARNYAKGAAALITRWPDNCSTSVAYWWFGVSMIAVTVFVIYNSVLIFGMIPTSDVKHPAYRTFNNEKLKAQMLSVPDVYMHLFVNKRDDELLNNYLPYATRLSKKYPNFKYKFLIVSNDTFKVFNDYKDEERNEIAFNSLWSNEKLNEKKNNKFNISIEYVSLSAYLNDSPLNKFWRHLPQHLVEFLVRSVSIWEKGGIAFNPKILIPRLYSPNYVKKLYDIFNNFSSSSSRPVKRKLKANKLQASTNTRRPNNIQDIINNLDKDSNNKQINSNSILDIDLSEAENKDIVEILSTEDTLKFKQGLMSNSKQDYNNNPILNERNNDSHNVTNFNETNYIVANSINSTHVVENILPLFLKYIFDYDPYKEVLPNNPDVLKMSNINTSLFDNYTSLNQSQSLPVNKKLKPFIERDQFNSTKVISRTSKIQNQKEGSSVFNKHKYDNIPELSMDIKGNIIASKTGCHAFLGTMFSNVIQHTEEETLTDFIISELSLFCGGLLTSCAGINVILV